MTPSGSWPWKWLFVLFGFFRLETGTAKQPRRFQGFRGRGSAVDALKTSTRAVPVMTGRRALTLLAASLTAIAVGLGAALAKGEYR